MNIIIQYVRVKPFNIIGILMIIFTGWILSPLLSQLLPGHISSVWLSILLTVIVAITVIIFAYSRAWAASTRQNNVYKIINSPDNTDEKSKSYFTKSFEAIYKKDNFIYNIPVYIILGNQTETDLFLNNSELKPYFGDNYVATGVVDNTDFGWRICKEGIFIDASKILTIDFEMSKIDLEWQKVLSFLQLLSTTPVTSIISIINAGEIITQESNIQSSIKSIEKTKEAIDLISSKLNYTIPLFVLFSKSENIEGYTEYTQRYTQTTNFTPLGFILNGFIEYKTKYSTLLTKIRNYSPVLLSLAITPAEKILITKFGDGLKKMKLLTEDILQTLGGDHVNKIKGVYFISNKYSVENAFAGDDQGSILYTAQAYNTSNLLINSIIKQIIPKSIDSVKKTPKPKLINHLLPYIAIILVIGGWSYLAYNHKQQTIKISDAISSYQNYAKTRYATPYNFQSTITALNHLYHISKIKNRYQVQGISFQSVDLPSSKKIRAQLKNIYQSAVNESLISLMSKTIEKNLYKQKIRPNKKYEALYIYALMGKKNPSQANKVINYIKNEIEKRRPNSKKLQSDFEFHYRIALKNSQNNILLSNNTVLNEMVKNYSLRDIEDILYRKLQRKYSNNNKIDVKKMYGQYVANYIKNKHNIPSIYTIREHADLNKNIEMVFNEYKTETKVFGVSSPLYSFDQDTMTLVLKSKYYRDYAEAWSKYIKGFNVFGVKDITTATELVNALLRLKNNINIKLKTSALQNLPENKHNNINRLIDDIKNTTALSDDQSVLLKLHAALRNNNKDDIDKFLKELEIKSLIYSDTFPLIKLTVAAIRRAIYAKTGNNIIKHWNTVIQPYCNKNIKYRYPLSLKSRHHINIKTFSVFFGPNGTLEKFEKNKLRKYIIKDANKWSWTKKGLTFNINKSFLKRLRLTLSSRKYLYKNGKLFINYKLKPLVLDPRVNVFKLTVANRTLSYSHGDPSYENLTWPGIGAIKGYYTFFTPGGKHSTNLPSSAWGWPKKAEKAYRKKHLITFKHNGFKAEYKIKPEKRTVRGLRLLRNFRCSKL